MSAVRTDVDERPRTGVEAWLRAILMWIIIAPMAAACAILSVPGTLFEAWVAGRVWAWLVTPTTHVAPPAFAVFVGADLLLSLYAKTRDDGATDRTAAEVVQSLATRLLGFPVGILCLAWLLAHFIGGAL